MKFLRYFLLLTLMILKIATALATEIPNESSLNRLMILSGLNKQISEFPGMVHMGAIQAREQGMTISEEKFQDFARILSGAIVPENILESINNELKDKLSQSDIEFLLAWYESDIGTEITNAEVKASTPEAMQNMMNQAETLLTDKPRVEIAVKLDQLTNATDMGLQMYTDSALTVSIAFLVAQNPFSNIDKESLRKQIEDQALTLRPNFEQLTIISCVYAYKSINIQDQELYLEFLEKPITMKFNRVVIESIYEALKISINNFAETYSKTLKKQT